MFNKRKPQLIKKNNNESELIESFLDDNNINNNVIKRNNNYEEAKIENESNNLTKIIDSNKTNIKKHPLLKEIYKNDSKNENVIKDSLEKDSNEINNSSNKKKKLCQFYDQTNRNIFDNYSNHNINSKSDKNNDLSLKENINRDGIIFEDSNNSTEYCEGNNKNNDCFKQEKNRESYGPIKLSNNIRSINQIDYAMGICTDFKRTGYCGYGDNCIFLHDRTDIKSSWEIDREIKKAKLKELDMLKKGININSKETFTEKNKLKDEITCPICKKIIVNPVSTICNHLYCEQCINNHYKNESKACLICNKHLKGVFNNSKLAEIKIAQYKENQIII